MVGFIVLLLLSVLFIFVALQNAQQVALHFFSYTLTGLPFFVVLIVSFILGIVIAFLLTSVQSLGTFFTIRHKENQLSQADRTIARLQDKIDELEKKNAQLRTGEPLYKENNTYKPSLMDRIRQSLHLGY